MLRVFLITLFLALYRVSDSSQTCQTGWTLYAGSCYGYGEATVNWFEAAAACAAHGGKLVEIETSAENSFVKNLARSKGNTVWIGGNDLFKEGTMTWASGSTSHIIFSDYRRGQPDNYRGSEDCLILRKEYDYQWNDHPCKSETNFICEARPLF